MYKRKLIILWLSCLCIIGVILFLAFFILKGESSFKIPEVVLIIYLFYNFKMIYDELNIYRMDKKNGIEEKVLVFKYTFSAGSGVGKGVGSICTFALFYDEVNKEAFTLIGDYSKITLIKEKDYKVSFLRYSKVALSIEDQNVSRIRRRKLGKIVKFREG